MKDNIYIKIKNTWIIENEDYLYANITIYKNKELIANIIDFFDENELRCNLRNYNYPLTENNVIKAVKRIVYNNIDKYLSLPKISDCSPLLIEIFNSVNNYEGYVFPFLYEDYELLFPNGNFSLDLKTLENEVKKYSLENVIVFNSDGYVLEAYPDLKTKFNAVQKTKNKEMER